MAVIPHRRWCYYALAIALGFPGPTALRPRRGPAGAVNVRWPAAVPNDPAYQSSQASYLDTIDVPAAWDVSTGSNSVIAAVLDTGVDAAHPDLAGRVVAGRNVVDADDDTTDPLGHGTKMAGILGAVANNAVGGAGVAWAVRIMPVKVTTKPDGAATDTNIAAGITWAVDHGARVINLSLGAPGDSAVLQTAVDYAAAHDALVVASAGNNSSDVPEFPAGCRGVLAVGATDASGRRMPFSNFGPWVDVNAPGVGLVTPKANSAGFNSATGTSAATALVSGVAVLLRATDPGATQAEIADRLRRSARGRGPVGVEGLDASGVVDAAAALRLPARRGRSGPADAGYLMVGERGEVDVFGDVSYAGDPWGDLGRARAVAVEAVPSGSGPSGSGPPGSGYWVLDENGRVFAFGGAPSYGELAGSPPPPGDRAVALRSVAGGQGYWIFTQRGRAVPFGSARSHGDLSGVALNRPIVAAAATPTGQGYLMAADDGGVFAFGDARFAGSTGGRPLNAPIRSMAADPGGAGYWLAAADGGVFAFDAPFRGSLGATHLNAPIAGMAGCGDGYFLVAADGGVFDFSSCPFDGSLAGHPTPNPVVGLSALGR